MSDPDLQQRLEELEAGAILGDLDREEYQEWLELSEQREGDRDSSLEFVAAAIESAYADENSALPPSVAERLQRSKADFVAPALQSAQVVDLSAWRVLFGSPQVGWAMAALFAVLLVAVALVENRNAGVVPPVVTGPPRLSPDEARDQLVSEAPDVLESEFEGLGPYEQMSGKVVWSDERQEGYMTLTNLPANNPDKNQYQLWIVDPDRDEKPVDGGVFDIPAGQSTAVVPIRNPLVVSGPEAFVITLEQPGGVVVSKQDVVVALAKPS